MSIDLDERAAALARARVPYVRATVVRALHPTSAHAGDRALVHADGQLEGFVGGTCAESSVRLHALEVLVSGEPLLLRVVAGAPATTVEEGAVTVANPCVSGGSVEIFLEPRRPAPRVVVVGDTPVAAALAALGGALGLDVTAGAEPPADGTLEGALDGVAAVVVASHGRGEEPALEAALRAGVPYVGLVASRVRAAAVLGSLDAEDVDRVRSPAGLDIGARSAPEIALSILAEVVARRASPRGVGAAGGAGTGGVPAGGDATGDGATAAAAAVDPVCGMSVAVTAQSLSAVVDGTLHHFCGEHCRAALLADAPPHAATP